MRGKGKASVWKGKASAWTGEGERAAPPEGERVLQGKAHGEVKGNESEGSGNVMSEGREPFPLAREGE